MTEDQKRILVLLTNKINELGLEARPLEEISSGPLLQVFRFLPRGRTSVAKLEALAQDFALTLGVEDVLVKRMPGETAVGVFVPRKDRQLVKWTDTVAWLWNNRGSQRIPLNFGVDHLGRNYIEDLTELPHLLIAGSTGGGKSVFLSNIISTLVYLKTSKEINFILSDTKGVEFGNFIGAPHLLFPPATNVWQTIEHMEWLLEVMEKRLKDFNASGARNIVEYHAKGRNLNYIVLIIDELADIMGQKKKVGEDMLAKIVQKSRATGIHVIAATQRPSVDIVQGVIKANFPARVSFKLPSAHDSKTILGHHGAEHLLSKGDMLYVSPNKAGLTRLHAPWASQEDLRGAVEAATLKEQMEQQRR